MTKLPNIITRVPNQGIPVSGMGKHAEAPKHVKISDTSPVRQVSNMTDYNPETGQVSDREGFDWNNIKEEPKPLPVKKELVKPEPTKQEPDRYAKWKEEEAVKKEKIEQAKIEKKYKSEQLASSLLSNGDLAGAAQALGMNVADFVSRVNQAAIGIKEEPKSLSPEEKFKKEQEDFRNEVMAWKQQQEARDNQQTAQAYIKDHISPLLQDKDKYEHIHHSDVNKIEQYVYAKMNEHYYQTSPKDEQGRPTGAGETLNAIEILDAIEDLMFQEHTQRLEASKGIKKVAKYFQLEQPEVQAENPKEEVANAPGFRKVSPLVSNPVEMLKANMSKTPPDDPRDEFDPTLQPPQQHEEVYAPKKTSRQPSTRPFYALSTAERMAIIREEEKLEQAQKRA